MREIPKKNYYILSALIIVVVLMTLSLASIYKNSDKLTSDFYNYSNKITGEEFNQYRSENSDFIIYISDKYDLSLEKFENSFKDKLNDLNLKSKLIYIDKKEISHKDIKDYFKDQGINIDKRKLPMIIVVVDNNVLKYTFVDLKSDANTILNYEVFEWLM